MGRNILLIGLGGFLGSASRYLIYVLLSRIWPVAFPLGTFAVNILGCLFIGVIFGLSGRLEWLTPQWQMFLATGFCGGFTTFSTFTFENAEMLQSGNYGMFAWYAIGSFAIGLLAVYLGLLMTKI